MSNIEQTGEFIRRLAQREKCLTRTQRGQLLNLHTTAPTAFGLFTDTEEWMAIQLEANNLLKGDISERKREQTMGDIASVTFARLAQRVVQVHETKGPFVAFSERSSTLLFWKVLRDTREPGERIVRQRLGFGRSMLILEKMEPSGNVSAKHIHHPNMVIVDLRPDIPQIVTGLEVSLVVNPDYVMKQDILFNKLKGKERLRPFFSDRARRKSVLPSMPYGKRRPGDLYLGFNRVQFGHFIQDTFQPLRGRRAA